jgi:mono/diheme cytochrome c family protein
LRIDFMMDAAVTALFFALCQDPKLEEPRPIVAGFERFGGDDPAEGGRLLLGELGCTNCHRADPGVMAQLLVKKAPLLADAGSRLRPDWLQKWIADPQAVKPGATMPKSAVAAEDIPPLVHYLMSLRSSPAAAPAAVGGDPAKAKDLFNRSGCAACHAPLDPKADLGGDKAVIPRGVLKEKYASAQALSQFLLDPLKWRPSGRMPKMNLTPQEAMSLATFAVGLPPRDADDPGETRAGLTYECFEGPWGKVPDFDSLKPYSTGTTDRFDIGVAKREENYGVRFRGYLEVPQDGTYTFTTHSDDGSLLLLGKTIVVNNDGIHGPQSANGTIALKKGKHAVTVGFIQAGGGAELTVSWQGPGIVSGPVPVAGLSHRADGRFPVPEGPGAAGSGFVVDSELAKRGREAFLRTCVSCHQVESKDQPVLARPLAQLKEGTCKAAQYSLNRKQSEAIAAALARLDPEAKPTAAERAHRTMLALNCFACHARGGKGGPEPGRNPYFATTGEDLGDEGRLPPHLNDVEVKLRSEWLRTLLGSGSKVRPYMQTRMPVFGPSSLSLADDFEKTRVSPEAPTPPRDKDLIRAGRQLVGSKGLSCITCHTFGGQKSLGIQGMDLVHMAQRLNRGWFGRYLLDPPGLRPGTRMPTYWPEGRSVLQTVLDGDTQKQIEAIWEYLSDGNKASMPVGIGPQPIPLEPKGEAIIYRNFIQGAGPRGIGVGYPERAHLAFDAQQMRLALLWQGEFIDASKHWVDRGAGFQTPLGENLVPMHEGAPFASLGDSTSPWPKETGHAAGYQFEGYTLDSKQRPAFDYRFGKLEVNDFFEAVEGKPAPSFKRTMTFESKEPPPNLWFRAAVSKKVEKAGDGAFRLENGLTLRFVLPAGDAPTVRPSGAAWELLVPLKLRDGKLTLVETFVW